MAGPTKKIGDLARPLLEAQLELLAKKNEDYGSGNLLIAGVRGVAVRLMDKAQRLLTLTESSREAHFESIADTFKDASNYGIIGQLLQDGALSALPKFVYLAGPIDVEHLDRPEMIDVASWRTYVTNELGKLGHAAYNPHAAIGNPVWGLAKWITAINNSAIESCDLMIANIGGALTLGTAREIEYAKSHGKRVIAIIPEGYQPLAIHDLECVWTVQEAIEHV